MLLAGVTSDLVKFITDTIRTTLSLQQNTTMFAAVG
jgi:hypothetical protein